MAGTSVETVRSAFRAYSLGDVLGEGDSGRVYAAVDDEGKEYAVKILDPARITKERSKRFQNEIRFGERNRHPNVVTVFDHGIAQRKNGDSPFYVMPRYDGSLRDLMKRLGDGASRLRYFDQILSGVEAAHLQSVTHRDLKPENVLYDREHDLLVVADFGIAHFTDEDLYTAVETKDDKRLANFQYAAPEQKSRGAPVDQRADIYGAGLILNELFTGAVPHGTGYVTIARDFPDLEWVDRIVDVMIRQQPDDRPKSIAVVKGALIAHHQEYVTRQRLDELRRIVIPTTEVSDPLAESPPQIVSVDWDRGNLWITLDKEVSPTWVEALHKMGQIGSYESLVGMHPTAFQFTGNRAHIQAREEDVQRVIDYFKTWMPLATAQYRRMIEQQARQTEERERAALRAQQEQLEQRQRVLSSVKF